MPPFFGQHNGPNNTAGDTAPHIKPTLALRPAGPALSSWGKFIDPLSAHSTPRFYIRRA